MKLLARPVIAMLIASLVLACASGLNRSRQVASCAAQEVFPVGTGKGVIFPAGRGHVEGYSPEQVAEFWTPSREEVFGAENHIEAYLQANAPSLISNIGRYARQYTGFYLGNQRFLFIQFLCGLPSELDWRCAPVVVDDGGDCYFHLEYDMDAKSCRNLWVNGNA